MSRVAYIVVIAASLALLGYLGLLALQMVEGRVTPLMMTAGLAAAVAVSLVSFLACLVLLVRTSKSLAQQKDMLRAVDMALRDYATRADQTTKTVSEVQALALRELDALKERQFRRLEDEQPGSPSGTDGALPNNVVPISAPAPAPDAAGQAAKDGYREFLKAAIGQGHLEVSLQPIVTVSRGEASGFEVFAHVEAPGLPARDIKRLESGLDLQNRAAFETLLFQQAVIASRRELGADGERMPLQVAISNALLQDADAVTAVTETYRKHPALAGSLVLSLPVHLINGAGRRHEDAIARLADAGAPLAMEGWRGNAKALRECVARGVRYIKLPADRLLDREKRRNQDLSGAEICEAAALASVDIVATGVDTDEDAVCLIDLGIDMMAGERFSGPRRLRRSAG